MVASSVEEAMALVVSVQPGLIVSDICMPGDDGYELVRRMRTSLEGRTVRAVALSAYSETRVAMRHWRPASTCSFASRWM